MELMALGVDKNLIDKDEYPQTAEVERRCVSMMADLWNAPGEAIGCSTIGSSEASMLGGGGREMAVAQEASAGRPAHGSTQHGLRQRADLLEEICPLLGYRDAGAGDASRRSVHHP